MSILSDTSATQMYTQQPFCRCEPGDIWRCAGWAGNLADGVIIIRRNRQPNPTHPATTASRWHATFVGFLECYECYQPN